MGTLNSMLDDIDSFLAPYGAKKLSLSEVKAHDNTYKEGHAHGWEIDSQVEYKSDHLKLHLIFSQIGFSLPKVYVAHDDFKPLSFPHIEDGGKMCIWSSQTIADLNTPDYLGVLLSDAVNLLNDAITGNIANDFEDEVLSYWEHFIKGEFEFNLSLLDVDNANTRSIYILRFNKLSYVIGENQDQLIDWYKASNGLESVSEKRIKKLKSRVQSTVLLNLESTLVPKEFPNTIRELINLINQYEASPQEAIVTLFRALYETQIPCPIVLMRMVTESGPVIVALKIARNAHYANTSKKKTFLGKQYINGFNDRLSPNAILTRMANVKVAGAYLYRADQGWLIGRGHNHELANISAHKVAIIGCGSVGSSIADLLIKSGIKDLLLVDSDFLLPENISRHHLGMEYIGKRKVHALKSNLSKNYPYVQIEAVSEKFHLGNNGLLEKVKSADIVLSATGDWYTDQALLEFQKKESFPIVFAFVEANAVAGHVVVNVDESEAFNSLHHCSGEKVGSMVETATKWNTETLIKIPACGGAFSPYGAVDVGFLHSLAVKKILTELRSSSVHSTHTIWHGSIDDLSQQQGQWNNNFRPCKCPRNSIGMYVREFVYKDSEWLCLVCDG